MKMSVQMAVTVLACSLMGCTAISVQPMDDAFAMQQVCIQENTRVIRGDFLPVLVQGFHKHGIDTKLVRGEMPDYCEFVVTYTATQTWDLAMVLKDAEVWIHRSGLQVAYANFHLRGGGGFSLMKWQGAEKKIMPMLDELLAEYHP
ncbi:Sbal_3080 family lipoprotein [Shewanella salipaludis]|uniref:Lipoprotein n=1 Tax=Shewanella salipaludis TaxID=2723052 RepID=A0A972FU98_9GAMM|nr:Sbal_3080 family lipoprotein [Shewanella salipaludis]NMH66280.1 hypothetical protein [Shewanella salipaludis]